MKKFIFTILLSSFTLGNLFAQTEPAINQPIEYGIQIGDFRKGETKKELTIDLALNNMPGTILYLGTDQKESLLRKVDTTIVVDQNPFGNELKRLSVSDDYVAIQTSEKGIIQLKILSLINDSKILCVVKTVLGQVSDSQVSFYTDKWKPLTTKELLPKFTLDWFLKPDVNRNSEAFKNAEISLGIRPYRVTLHPLDDGMDVKFDIWNYLSEEDKKMVEKILSPKDKELVWDKASFVVK